MAGGMTGTGGSEICDHILGLTTPAFMEDTTHLVTVSDRKRALVRDPAEDVAFWWAEDLAMEEFFAFCPRCGISLRGISAAIADEAKEGGSC